MDNPQHCQDQAAECRGLIKKAQSEAEAQVLRNLVSSWSRVASQVDRYIGLVRERGRPMQKK